MLNKLIQVHKIRPETKYRKLLDSIDMLSISIKKYRNTGDIRLVLRNLAKVYVIVLGIAITEHSVNIKEFNGILKLELDEQIRRG